MYSVFDIANWFLAQRGGEITNKKLQGLAYYAYAWFLTFNNEDIDDLSLRFFDNRFEAWVHGAVYPELFEKYRQYGASSIPQYEGELPVFSPDELDVLEQTRDVYGGYNGNELESICHQESPWLKARAGIAPFVASHNPIEDKDIFECFASRL